MALAYLDLFADAVATYGALLADGGAPGPDDPLGSRRRESRIDACPERLLSSRTGRILRAIRTILGR